MKIKVRKLSPEAVIPKKAHDLDAAWDLQAVSLDTIDNKDYGYIEYKTGLAIAIPKGYVGLLFPRSSISNTGLLLSNSVGVIDPGYQGEVKVRFKYIKDSNLYRPGDRIIQLIVIQRPELEFEEVEVFDESERGDGGFGSSNTQTA